MDVVLNAKSHFKVKGCKVIELLCVFVCFHSVKQSSMEGLEAARMELEEREKVREELQGIQGWLEAADGLLSEMEQSSSTQELQVGRGSIRAKPHLLFVFFAQNPNEKV